MNHVAAVTQAKSQPVILAILIAPFILLASWNIWISYSYWLDELISVVNSGGTWLNLLNSLLNDVHPFLYQVILKLWIDLLGSSENVTRTLSLIFCVSAVITFALYLRNKPKAFAYSALLYFCSTWLFAYYAQETRSYAMLLFLSTIAATMDARREESRSSHNNLYWYAALIMLSLTHYFGLIYAGLLLLIDIYRTIKYREYNIFPKLGIGMLMLVWPILHFTYGSLGAKTGGEFWIHVDGIEDTFKIFLTTISKKGLSIFLLIIPLALYTANTIIRPALYRLLIRIILFVLIIALIDLHTPISTPRNYIVLVPAMSLLFGISVLSLSQRYSRGWKHVVLVSVLGIYYIGSGYVSVQRMSNKWGAIQNWKGLAETVESGGICQPHCWFLAHTKLYSYYFANSMGEIPAESTLGLDGIINLSVQDRLPIIATHNVRHDLERLQKHYPGWVCLQPKQKIRNGIVIIIEPSRAPDGLLPCD